MTTPPVTLRGEARIPGGEPRPATITLDPDGFRVSVGDAAPWSAAYRDVASVVVDAGDALVVLGSGPGSERWLFERFGSGLGTLVRGIRDGRLRQWLTDGLVDVPDDASVTLVELSADVIDSSSAGTRGAFAGTTGSAPIQGIAQLIHDARGVTLAPLDEGLPRLRIRRADIGAVRVDPATGSLHVDGSAGRLASGRSLAAPSPAAASPSGAVAIGSLDLLRLGTLATSQRDRWIALRDGAALDVSAILSALVPDAPFQARHLAASVMREGRPASPAELGEAWAVLESAMLVDPGFADSYRALVSRGGGSGSGSGAGGGGGVAAERARAALRWLALAPDRPGQVDPPRLWTFVALPGNLVALELVGAGAHATYLFRVVPRASFDGRAIAPSTFEAAVNEISAALIDGRFLREPMALPAGRLAEPGFLRYRLALAALPSLASARARFVGRIVHRDAASWAAALDDLIGWHATARDDLAEWSGRAAQEAQVDEASATEASATEASATEASERPAAEVTGANPGAPPGR